MDGRRDLALRGPERGHRESLWFRSRRRRASAAATSSPPMDPGSPRSAARTLEDPPLPRGVSRPGLPLELPGAEVVYSKTQNPLLDVARNAELRAELAAGGPLAGASHADLTMEGGGARSGGALRRNIGFDVRKYKAQVRPVPESYIEVRKNERTRERVRRERKRV